MRTRTAALALAAITTATLALTGCSSSEPDLAACKAALAKQDATQVSDNAQEPDRPDECEGVNTATLVRLLNEIDEEQG
ncbi:hypothetical protein [Actinacidiphila glaucinigra]|uniref:hypothetical protein n=1 Tax=Actinacidiphila glaucinigra TaxID=235986 RepID=UPI0029BE9653|nr:hypothetical protein [Streptomyces sp. PA03-3a]